MPLRFSLRHALLLLSATLVAQTSAATLVTWTVDSDESFVRWNVPDQTVNIGGSPVAIRIRDMDSTTVWTDAGGRRAVVEGEIVTDFVPDVSIQFLTGQHTMAGIDDKALRPNPAAYSLSTLTYTNTSTAPAAFGGRLRSSLIGDLGYFSFRETEFDIGSGVLALDSFGAFAGSQTSFGALDAMLALDIVSSLVGPDSLSSIAPAIAANLAGGTITEIGPGTFRLDYQINTPLPLLLGPGVLSSTLTGTIVAYGSWSPVPEPSTAILVGVATALLSLRPRPRSRS